MVPIICFLFNFGFKVFINLCYPKIEKYLVEMQKTKQTVKICYAVPNRLQKFYEKLDNIYQS